MAEDQRHRCPKCRSVMVVKGTVAAAKSEKLVYCAGCGHEEWQDSTGEWQKKTQKRDSFA